MRKIVGRPTKYKSGMPELVLEYLKSCAKEDKLPQISEICLKLEITRDTLNRWIKLNKRFSDTINRLNELQETYLVEKSTKRQIDPNFGKFLLSAKHGYIETSKTVNEGNQPVTIQLDMSGGYLPPQTVTAPLKLQAKSKPN